MCCLPWPSLVLSHLLIIIYSFKIFHKYKTLPEAKLIKFLLWMLWIIEKGRKYNHTVDKYCNRKYLFWIKGQWNSNDTNWETDWDHLNYKIKICVNTNCEKKDD